MRFLFEQMGAAVTWDDATQTATAAILAGADGEQERSVTFGIDNTTATVNGSKTMVPLRFLSENLGFDVQWDEATRTAIVTTE